MLYAIYGSVDSSALLRLGPKLHTYSSNSCVVLVLAVCTSGASWAATALMLLASLLVDTVYCLLYVIEYGVPLLAILIPERLTAACYLLWSFLTKYQTCQET